MVVPYLSNFEDPRRNLGLYRDAFAAATRALPIPRVQMSFHMHAAETDRQAIAEATPQMEQYVGLFKASASAWRSRRSSAYPGYEELVQQLETMTMERVQRERRAFIGSPQTIVALIQNAVELFGDIEPSLSVLWGNMPYAAAERSLRLFAGDVIPWFAPTPATSTAR